MGTQVLEHRTLGDILIQRLLFHFIFPLALYPILHAGFGFCYTTSNRSGDVGLVVRDHEGHRMEDITYEGRQRDPRGKRVVWFQVEFRRARVR